MAARKYESDFDRMLDFNVKHAAWIIFRSIYWSIYPLTLGLLLLYYSVHGVPVSLQVFGGIALSVLAMMVILFGFSEVLHHRLMQKYG